MIGYCNNIKGPLKKLGVTEYKSIVWVFSIDISKSSLKCALLHSGNTFGYIPFGPSTNLKGKGNGIKFAQEKTSYYEHECIICAKLKMLGFLLWLQSGYTKFLFFRLCAYLIAEVDSNLDKIRLACKIRSTRCENIEAHPLVERSEIVVPPIHIKFGIMKQIVKHLTSMVTVSEIIAPNFHN